MTDYDGTDYDGHISVGAAYHPDTGALLSFEIYEADEAICVDLSVLRSLLRPGPPWASFDEKRLRLHLSDGNRDVVYRLDGVDPMRKVFYFRVGR